MGSLALITLNPSVGREEGSAPLIGVLVDLPCNEERAGSLPPMLAACPHPQQSLAQWTSLLLQTFLIFLWDSVERETPIKAALVTLQVLPGLEKIQGLLWTFITSHSSKLRTWGTHQEQMVLVLGKRKSTQQIHSLPGIISYPKVKTFL